MSEKLTVQEILAQLSDAIQNGDNAAIAAIKRDYEDESIESIIRSLITEYEEETLPEALPEMVELVSFDGGEGSAEDAPEAVYKFKPTEQYFGLTGWYASYQGTEWDDGFKEFEPVSTVVYQVKRKKK